MKHFNLAIIWLLFISLFLTRPCIAQFSFVHITDLHVSDRVSYFNDADVNGEAIRQMLEAINNLNPKPAFVVASGDISNIGNSGDGMYNVLTQYLYPSQLVNPVQGAYFINTEQTIPIYFTPGNHDYYTTLFPPLSGSNIGNYISNVSPDNDFEIIYKNAIVLFLRSGSDKFRSILIDNNLNNPEGSGLTATQCEYARTILKENENKKKIIVMHHPAVDAAGTNSDGTPFTQTIVDTADGAIINNRTMFLNICDSNHVDVVLSGHVHQNVVTNRAGNVVEENYTASTRYVQTGACLYGSYRIITVDNAIVTVGTPQRIVLTGIAQAPEIDKNVSVYYIPEQKNIVVSCSNIGTQTRAQIQIYNITGQEVFSQVYELSNGIQVNIPVMNLPKGFNILTLRNGNISVSKKLIIN